MPSIYEPFAKALIESGPEKWEERGRRRRADNWAEIERETNKQGETEEEKEKRVQDAWQAGYDAPWP